MAAEKVLLMHGPAQLPYRPPYPEQLFYPYVAHDCRPGITLMARAYRALGFKIAYSGWEEDAEWLRENAGLFDFLAISDQHRLRTESDFFGQTIANNKEKLYYSVLAGVRAIRAGLGDDAVVFRVRADVMVHQGHIAAHAAVLRPGSGDVMIEYCSVDNLYSTPDFMLLAEVCLMDLIYTGLYERSRAGTSYHLSSHVDHTLTYLALKEQGLLGRIICMQRTVHDTALWRGLPRYFEEIEPALQAKRGFGIELIMGDGATLAELLTRIVTGAIGPQQPAPAA
ncbi:hypothetical protein GTP38_20105 [Duganella sp. FT94W]|uniref:Uncharacterized protein n=1 Tax=Duganella lactea TaxID=2692173 RepID=A0ABW9VDI0_9BURK|nr:hypothetical protein [Duganella lactea]MYM36638.1 hypothetical protein [Duganella lactea]